MNGSARAAGWRGKGRWKAIGFGGGFLLLLLLLWRPGIVTSPLERYLIEEHPLERADALILMAGEPEARLPSVIRLYREGVAPRILLTNDGVLGAWSAEHGRNLYQVEWTELALLQQRVPAEAVFKLGFSVSGTMHDARHAVSFARSMGLRRLLVVTSDFHSRRTLWSFRKVADDDPIEVGVYPARPAHPSARDFQQLWKLGREMSKLLGYRLVYGIGGVDEGL